MGRAAKEILRRKDHSADNAQKKISKTFNIYRMQTTYVRMCFVGTFISEV